MVKEYKNLNKRLTLKYFWQIMKLYKVSFFVIVFGVIIASVLDIYIPFQYLKLWNLLDKNNFILVNQARSVIIFILILNLLRWAIKRVNGFSLAYFEAKVIAGLRTQAFSYLIGHSHSFFVNNFAGSLTQKINRYARAFEKLVDRMVMDGLPLIFRGIGTVIAIYTLFPKYAYVLGIFCLIFLITTFFYIRFKLKYDILSAEADSKTTGALSDPISNHSSIQLFTGHKYEKKIVGEVIKKQQKATIFNWYLWEGLGAVGGFYTMTIEFIIFWMVLGDWKLGLIGLPVIVLLQNYLVRLIENLWSFGNIVRTFYESFADAQEMVTILSTPYEIKDEPKTKLQKIAGEITFNGVSYVYENNNVTLLNNFSIKIKPGEKVALIGTSGAGKTTFVRLLMRFFEVKNGNIMIDGIDIKDVSQENLREQIAFVPQEPVLFHRTLMENIRYGNRNVKNEEVIKAARLAHCDKFIEALPEKYETYVGERGVKLSGGERQRVAIARAILKNAPILILDEATSSLDSHSEALIQDALEKLLQGKTAIVIAHRLSTIRQMDRIVVIQKGKIIEDGTHDDLIKKEKGVYKRLWEIQASGFESLA